MEVVILIVELGGVFIVIVVVVVVVLLLLTVCNRLQPIVIQCRRFVPIITRTCCMGPGCALVLFFTACQFACAGR